MTVGDNVRSKTDVQLAEMFWKVYMAGQRSVLRPVSRRGIRVVAIETPEEILNKFIGVVTSEVKENADRDV